ncbi:MAG TPA: DUF5668 domain-containing protein [Candidatus Paceibacterota bacterium]|nr:DUF5668 domain-containing protein [Candidatus Paceibacterota bacterium]
MENGKDGMKCNCMHHKTMPVLVVLFGLDFLAYYMGWVSGSFLNISWPLLVIVGGLAKLGKGRCKCC